MLIRFHVSNFLSFNEEIELSLIPGRARQHPTHVLKEQVGCDIKSLRAAVIYGANASGKSNLIKAMDVARQFILEGAQIREAIPRTPFKLCKDGASRVSKFEFEFRQGGRCYVYGFEIDNQRVHVEWLYEIKKTTEVLLFERVTTSDGENSVEFGKLEVESHKEQERLQFVSMGTRPNQLFLTESMERNVKYFADVYRWFAEVLVIIYPHSQFLPLAIATQDSDFGVAMASSLEQLGTGIHGFKLMEVNPDSVFSDALRRELRGRSPADNKHVLVTGPAGERYIVDFSNGDINAKKLKFRHRMGDCEEDVLLEIEEESDGTRRLLDLLPTFGNWSHRDQVIVIDELDRSLHPQLSYKLLKLFFEDSSSQSQLIATTHEEHLLDLDLLRRDEIWFIEKDQSGASRVYSLEEFAPRYDKDIEGGYLRGRFGAIPVFGKLSFGR